MISPRINTTFSQVNDISPVIEMESATNQMGKNNEASVIHFCRNFKNKIAITTALHRWLSGREFGLRIPVAHFEHSIPITENLNP